MSTRFLRNWLGLLCILIVAMISTGGITRLTQSGLSIVQWKPIVGIVPPLNHQAWLVAFEEYKLYPQYHALNPGMTLSEFKGIFYWEYGHRLLGRMIALVLLAPWLWAWTRGFLTREWSRRIGLILLLVLAQGALGWFMVMSGLIHQPRVSHYRLAAHLSLALILLGYVYWQVLKLRASQDARGGAATAGTLRLSRVLVNALLGIQIVYGAFTAGLRAGFASSTFPDWNGRWVPETLSGAPGTQYLHRVFGTALLLAIVPLWIRSRHLSRNMQARGAVTALALLALTQYGLGVATVMLHVPIPIAATHQLFGCLLFLACLRVNFELV